MAIKTGFYGSEKIFNYESSETINGKNYDIYNIDVRNLGEYAEYNIEQCFKAGLQVNNNIFTMNWEVLIFNGAMQTGALTFSEEIQGLALPAISFSRFYIDNRFAPYVNKNGITTFKVYVDYSGITSGRTIFRELSLSSYSTQQVNKFTNLQVSNTNTDELINITWDNPNDSQQQIWVTNSLGNIVYEKHFLNQTTHTIPANTLTEGNHTLNIQPYAVYAIKEPITYEFGKIASKTSVSMALTRPTPKILTLEPNNIPQSKDDDILTSWTSENQQEFELKVKLDGVLVKTYTGTTEQYINITKGTIPNTGNVELTLTIKYMPTWGMLETDKRVATKTATFLAFGKPTTPTITSGTTFDTSRPTIAWGYDDEQVAFQLTILKDSQVIVDSGIVYGAMTSYKLSHSLENNTSYTVRLKIRNQYNAFSDEATQTISIAYAILQAPTFYIRSNNADGSIIIDITNPAQLHLAYCEIYRKSDNEDWMRIAKDLSQNDSFTDYGLVNNKIYDYKIRAVSDQEGYTDSDVKKCSVTLSHTQLIDVTDISKILSLRFSPNKTLNIHRGINTMDYVGRRGISVEYNAKQYTSISCSFAVRDKDKSLFLELFSSGNTLLYRDNRNLKLYGHIINEPQVRINNNGWCDISFVFAESDYSEVV